MKPQMKKDERCVCVCALQAGEERFSVEVDEEDRVWYEVVSLSKPAHILATLCYPYVQLRQKHFARQSGQAIRKHLSAAK